MATKREIEHELGSWLSAALDDHSACDEFKTIVYEWMVAVNAPHDLDAERREFEARLHLLDEAKELAFPDSEKQLEGMWLLWKAARGIE